MKRPESLARVVELAGSVRDLHYGLADFLDQFAIEKRPEMLADEPARLAGRFPEGDVADAYLAAVAVSLARSISAYPPSWSWAESRKLPYPWFAHPGASLRATLLTESPAAFRERNLFVSANALTRA